MLRKLIIAAGATTALGNQSFLQGQQSAEKGNNDNTANAEEKKDKCCGSGKKEEEKKEETKKEEAEKGEKKEKPAEGELASFVQKPDGCQSCGGKENEPKNQNGTNGEKPNAEPAKPDVAAPKPEAQPEAQPKQQAKPKGKPSTHHLRGNSKDAHVSELSKAAKIGSQVHEAAVSTAAGYYQAAKNKVSTALQSAQDKLYGAKETVHSHIKSHPVTSAAVAAAGSTAALTAYYGGTEQMGIAALNAAGGLSSMASSAWSTAAGALSYGASMGGAMLAKLGASMSAL